MKTWYNYQHIRHLTKMFDAAVEANDGLGAASVFGCMFDLFQTAQQRAKMKKGYGWKRRAQLLGEALAKIDEAAYHYPVTIQKPLAAKAMLFRKAKEQK